MKRTTADALSLLIMAGALVHLLATGEWWLFAAIGAAGSATALLESSDEHYLGAKSPVSKASLVGLHLFTVVYLALLIWTAVHADDLAWFWWPILAWLFGTGVVYLARGVIAWRRMRKPTARSET